MKVLEGYLTEANKKAIKAIINAGLTEGRISNKNYFITEDKGFYIVKIQQKDRGLIPCPGSPLRLSTYVSKFTL